MKTRVVLALVCISCTADAMTSGTSKKVMIASADSVRLCAKFTMFETAWLIAHHIIDQIEQLKKTDPTISYTDTRKSLPSTRAVSAQGLALHYESMVPVACVTPWGLWRFIDDVTIDHASLQKIGISLHDLITLSPIVSEETRFAILRCKQLALPVFKLQKTTPLTHDYTVRLLEWNYFTVFKDKNRNKKLLCKKTQARL